MSRESWLFPHGSIRLRLSKVGAVVHGFMLQGEGGGREGTFLENSQERMDLHDDAGVARRGA